MNGLHTKLVVTVTIFALSISVLFTGCGGSGDSSGKSGSVDTGRGYGSVLGYYTVGENGISCSPWGDGSSNHRPAMAVKFTPPSYPITITSVTIYAKNNTGVSQAFNLYGFSDDLSAETEIFSSVQNQSIPNTGSLCLPTTISIPAMAISSGTFNIAVEWVTKPLASLSGSNSFFLCTDSTLNYTNTSFFRYTGSTWVPLESVSVGGGDLGILINYR